MITRDRFIQRLQDDILIGDGALGTNLGMDAAAGEAVEELNLSRPEAVLHLHRNYVDAGSNVIETNTFRADALHLAGRPPGRVHDVIVAGVRLARDAAGATVLVAGAVGPLPAREGEWLPEAEQRAVYGEILRAFAASPPDVMLFETFTRLHDLETAVRACRAAMPDMPIIAQLAFEEGQRTASGDTPGEAVRLLSQAGADVVGANCGAGVPQLVAAIRDMANASMPLSAYMNAGFADAVDGRRVHVATPEYLARRARQLVDMGVRLVGGCCGTGPSTIREIARTIERHPARPRVRAAAVSVPAVPFEGPRQPRPPQGILVELDPPFAPDCGGVLAAAQTLADAGVTQVTVADNPLAAACVDTLTVAHCIRTACGVSVIPHLTGRDRNRIALKSFVMGAHVQGVESILCVTGDPVRMHSETNTTGVFDVTSIGLIELVRRFNEGGMGQGMQTALAIGVAFNPNVRSLNSQIDKLKRKVDTGAHFALTQPMFDGDVFDRARDALDAAGVTIPVFPGILPLRSVRNAEFLHNEVPGMRIPDAILKRLDGFDRVADQKKAGIDIAQALMDRFAPAGGNLYLIAPRNRVDLVLPLLGRLHGQPAKTP
jgi:methionine synthase / methylenetetrahydrofolate reductase(NADPH)